MVATNALAVHAGKQASSPLAVVGINVTFDNSYPTGGYAWDPQALLKSLGKYDQSPEIVAVLPEPKSGYMFEYDRVNTKLKVLQDQASGARDALAHLTLSSAGLAIGVGSNKKVLIANTVNYLIAGVFKSKTTAEVAFTATTHDIPADAGSVQEAVYLVTLDASGNITLTMGEIAEGAGNAEIPAAPANQAIIGYVRIAVAAGSTDFDASSDALNAGHLTVTYVNLAFNPDAVTPAASAFQEVSNGTNLAAITARVMVIAK